MKKEINSDEQFIATLSEEDFKHHWTRAGIYFGFPHCCIKEFIDPNKDEKDRSLNFQAANNTGFVPCDKHTEQIINGVIKLEDLIQDRICKTAFPNQDDKQKTFREFYSKMKKVQLELQLV